MDPEALYLTDPTFEKEEVSFGGAPEYFAAMYSKNGEVITGELIRRAGEALSQGLRGKEALNYLRTHALNPHPSEDQVKALKERVEYRIKPGSEKG